MFSYQLIIIFTFFLVEDMLYYDVDLVFCFMWYSINK